MKSLILLFMSFMSAPLFASEYSFVLHQESTATAGCTGGGLSAKCFGAYDHEYTATGPQIATLRICGENHMVFTHNGEFPLEGECVEFLDKDGQVLATFNNVQPEKPIDLSRTGGVRPKTRMDEIAETRQFFIDQESHSSFRPDHCAAQTTSAVVHARNVDFKIDPTKTVALWTWTAINGEMGFCHTKPTHRCAAFKVWDSGFRNFADTDVLYDTETCEIIDVGFKFDPNFGNN